MNQGSRHHRARKLREAMRLALAEFLLVPTGIIVGFLLLAACTFVLDRSSAAWLMPIRTLLQAYVFGDARATGDLLGTIAAGLITITSITISLLLIALQQSASALTHQVYDCTGERRGIIAPTSATSHRTSFIVDSLLRPLARSANLRCDRRWRVA